MQFGVYGMITSTALESIAGSLYHLILQSYKESRTVILLIGVQGLGFGAKASLSISADAYKYP